MSAPPCAHPGCTAAAMYAEHPDRLGAPPDWPAGPVRWLCAAHASPRPWLCAHPGCAQRGVYGHNSWTRGVALDRLTGPEIWYCAEHEPSRRASVAATDRAPAGPGAARKEGPAPFPVGASGPPRQGRLL